MQHLGWVHMCLWGNAWVCMWATESEHVLGGVWGFVSVSEKGREWDAVWGGVWEYAWETA